MSLVLILCARQDSRDSAKRLRRAASLRRVAACHTRTPLSSPPQGRSFQSRFAETILRADWTAGPHGHGVRAARQVGEPASTNRPAHNDNDPRAIVGWGSLQGELGQPKPNHHRRQSTGDHHGVADRKLAELVGWRQPLALLGCRAGCPAAGLVGD